MMSGGQASAGPGSGVYEIQVEGQLDSSWTDWFDGWSIRSHTPGETVLQGWAADQSALHGLLLKIHHLSLTLVSVRRLTGNRGME